MITPVVETPKRSPTLNGLSSFNFSIGMLQPWEVCDVTENDWKHV